MYFKRKNPQFFPLLTAMYLTPSLESSESIVTFRLRVKRRKFVEPTRWPSQRSNDFRFPSPRGTCASSNGWLELFNAYFAEFNALAVTTSTSIVWLLKVVHQRNTWATRFHQHPCKSPARVSSGLFALLVNFATPSSIITSEAATSQREIFF